MITKKGERRCFEMQFRHKKHQKKVKKNKRYANKKFRHNYRINIVEIKQGNKKCERKNKIGAINNDV